MLKNEIIFQKKNFPREFEPKDWFENVDTVPFFFFFLPLLLLCIWIILIVLKSKFNWSQFLV